MEIFLNILCTEDGSLQRRVLKVGVQSPGSLEAAGSSSPEPGSKMKPWLWRLVEGCLPLSYFFPQTPHDPYLWLLPKSPPLHFPGSLALGLNAQGVNCRDGIHHTGKKFISVIDVSLDSTRVEKRGDVEGRWKVWNTQGTDRGHGCSLRL